jgi:hypothetical protein
MGVTVPMFLLLGEFSPNFDLKIYDFVLCKGFFTKEKKDPSSLDFEFFFLIARFF